ncbi:MBL fold metallo-hydrolase [Pedobacter petrophilus]|uniref:MBL fold metallo-hydrolase n=1 Tax=Pedobacter petrophilus TaxID=1908241 RepID=A0A7K0G3D9_9SPHI|nr:MBL fold metallo-hydrolase [Pedobacter petrophilus]MRX78152.1 MBL fold metallo-hydrolase [Pedobacter petrophilus]
MRTSLLSIIALLISTSIFAQIKVPEIKGKEVSISDDVIFHQLDEHTWVGSGHVMAGESLYLLEGNDRALLIDCGTKIANLDKVVAAITKKPVMLVATHVHPDHVGSASCFPEIYINPADTVNIPSFLANFKGAVKYLKDGEIIDLGGRKVEVLFTPAHTPGATTYIDKSAGYGFSGDSFGSGNLLLTGTFKQLIATCEKTSAFMEKNAIKFFYPGHFFGKNLETKQRIYDLILLSKDVLSGKVKGQENPGEVLGLNLIVSQYGVRINYNERALYNK